jgi:DNA-binding NarL/FixJ family response regulator
LRAGASGFLLKDTPPHRLLSAIGVVAAGDMLFAPAVTRRMIEAYTARPDVPAPTPELAQLTSREVEVLRLVARGRSNAEIGTHLNRTMAKLGLCSRAQVVVFAYETDLVRPGQNDPSDDVSTP